MATDPVLGKHLVASTNIKEGEVILQETPLVVGPAQQTIPVCLSCYTPVDGSYKCPRSGWPLKGPECARAVAKNPEVVIPSQCDAQFEIEDYDQYSYMYECIIVLRALLLQRTNPTKYKALMSMESHMEERRGTELWTRTQENVVDVMKKTLGVMVFEALYPEMDFSDDTIQKIQGILETNKKEIRLAASDVEALYITACLMEHSCKPNVKITFEKDFTVRKQNCYFHACILSLDRSLSGLAAILPKVSTSPPCTATPCGALWPGGSISSGQRSSGASVLGRCLAHYV